ncbi:MAG: ribonuclease Z [Bacteroidales bacterium]
MIFSVTILGSSSALPTVTRFPSAHVINAHERLFLVDCAEGTQMQLRKFHIKMNRINNIFISHLHGDHVLGLFGLISTFNLLSRKAPLNIYAHPDLEKILVMNTQFFTDNITFPVKFHPLDTAVVQTIYEDQCITVSTLPLRHRMPTVGFLFKEKQQQPNIRKDLIDKYSLGLADIVRVKNGEGFTTSTGEHIPSSELTYYSHLPRSYAYCSDTLYSERLVGLVKNVDLLYHEATFLTSELSLARQTGHSTAAQAATVARKANAGRLIIGHFSSRYKSAKQHEAEAREIFPNTAAVDDGQVYSIAEKKYL